MGTALNISISFKNTRTHFSHTYYIRSQNSKTILNEPFNLTSH